MPKVIVLHRIDPTFMSSDGLVDFDDFENVGAIEVDNESVNQALGQAFHKSQNIEDAWRPDRPCRSTSVGDVMKFGEQWYEVMGVGFRRVEVRGTPPGLARGGPRGLGGGRM
jgi:hypothetical protein